MPATAANLYETKTLGAAVDATAPDGTAVRLLLSLAGGSMAHFELPAGAVSHAVTHRTVEEIWFVVSGRGSIWRRQDERRADRPAWPRDVADHPARNGVSVSRRGRLGACVRGDHHAALGLAWTRPCPRQGPWTPTVAAGSAEEARSCARLAR